MLENGAIVRILFICLPNRGLSRPDTGSARDGGATVWRSGDAAPATTEPTGQGQSELECESAKALSRVCVSQKDLQGDNLRKHIGKRNNGT